MEAEFFECFETVDDAAATTAPADFRAAQFHGEYAVSFEADVAHRYLVARRLLGRGGFDDGGAGFAAKQQGGGVTLGVAADQQHFLTLLGHHVGEVGKREALADTALTVDRNDLGLGCIVSGGGQ